VNILEINGKNLDLPTPHENEDKPFSLFTSLSRQNN
jgi:hypothetical protein